MMMIAVIIVGPYSGVWWGVVMLQYGIICDMIKRNESDVGNVVFDILAKQCSNSFVLIVKSFITL